jgi:hypothetical protein
MRAGLDHPIAAAAEDVSAAAKVDCHGRPEAVCIAQFYQR